MTVITTISKGSDLIKTKTEVYPINEKRVMFTRIIDSEIYPIELIRDKPITAAQVANICKMEDDLFKSLSE